MAETKFGKRIRSIRQNAECSQKEFCTVLDIPQSTLSAYETDRMQPTVATLINIATKFNVSLDWLCGIDKTNGGKDNTEIQYLPTAKKLIAQPAPPTVKLNGTNFTAEIPAYVFTELMSVLLEKLEK